MSAVLTRRRFLAISAAAAATPAAAAPAVVRWRGRALGASATMVLTGVTRAEAAPVFRAVERELARLERIFSLYDPQSEIARLNRAGRLAHPSSDLLSVLTLSGRLNAATQGAFDPTIQPVWRALAEGRDPSGAARAVGWQNLELADHSVHFARPGMGLTLNGIAQGYITDRIAGLLRANGLTDLVIDMGEIAALGQRPDGRAWRAGIAGPEGAVLRQISLRDRALATSSPAGTAIGPGGASGHILDPRAPSGPPVHSTASVSADSAAVADGLSTALCLLHGEAAAAAVARFPGARIELLEQV